MTPTSGQDKDGVPFLEVKITRSSVGDGWPLTVPWAMLRVYSGAFVTLNADGQEYALNGLALGCGFRPAHAVWAAGNGAFPRQGLAPLFEIAREQLGHRTDLTAAEIAALPRPTPREEF
jgi:hypothetical protein